MEDRSEYFRNYYKNNCEKLKTVSIINRNKSYLFKEKDIFEAVELLLARTKRRRLSPSKCKIQKIVKHTTLYFN